MGILARAIENNVNKRWHPAKWPGKTNAKTFERWLITGKHESENYTGKNVDEESALSASAVWSAVTQLSQAVASLPLHLYKRLERGKDRA